MDIENKTQDTNAEKNEASREGYKPTGNFQRDYHASGKPQRPRIRTQRAYTTDRDANKEAGFRPEGFGAGLQSASGASQQSSYRPRYNSNGGGYQQRGNYNQNRQQGGYQPRQQGGFRPRYNNNNTEEGAGYQPRTNYGQPRQQGGYQPRQQGGYRPRYNNPEEEGAGFQQAGGYRPNRQQGGYQQRGGYNPNRQQGGYQQRGGYNQNRQQGGYQQGGYRQRTPGYDPNAKYSFKKRIEYKEDHIDPNEPIRLNKYLANAGVCSRREADEFIQAGVVTVNGNVVTELGTKVLRSDEVKFHDQTVSLEKKVYVLLNKPKDYVTLTMVFHPSQTVRTEFI